MNPKEIKTINPFKLEIKKNTFRFNFKALAKIILNLFPFFHLFLILKHHEQDFEHFLVIYLVIQIVITNLGLIKD